MPRELAGTGQRTAAFDLGSNTARGILAEPSGDGSLTVLATARRMTALGRGLSTTGVLDPDGLASTVGFVGGVLAEWGRPERAFAVATAAAREAANARDLADELFRRAQIRLDVIDGEEEARLSYLGALSVAPDLAERNPVVVDVGGRSTEVAFRDGDRLRAVSLPFGARMITERYLRSDPPGGGEMNAAVLQALRGLSATRFIQAERGAVVVAGGTAQAVILLGGGSHETTRSALAALSERLCAVALPERRAMMSFDPERAEIICGGVAILQALSEQAAGNRLFLTEGGVREGLLLDRTGATRLRWD